MGVNFTYRGESKKYEMVRPCPCGCITFHLKAVPVNREESGSTSHKKQVPVSAQKAFNMYQEKFEHKVSVGTSVNSCDAILKKYSFPCSICGGTAEEKMEFVRWLAVRFLDLQEEEVWFGDKLHYFSYNEHYALSVNTYHSPLLVFSCDDILLKKKIDAQLNSIFS